MSWGEYLKLSDVAGRKVVEVRGRISTEFGDPTFRVVAVEFDDGTAAVLEAERDFPYVLVKVPERFHEKEDES